MCRKKATTKNETKQFIALDYLHNFTQCLQTYCKYYVCALASGAYYMKTMHYYSKRYPVAYLFTVYSYSVVLSAAVLSKMQSVLTHKQLCLIKPDQRTSPGVSLIRIPIFPVHLNFVL